MLADAEENTYGELLMLCKVSAMPHKYAFHVVTTVQAFSLRIKVRNRSSVP